MSTNPEPEFGFPTLEDFERLHPTPIPHTSSREAVKDIPSPFLASLPLPSSQVSQQQTGEHAAGSPTQYRHDTLSINTKSAISSVIPSAAYQSAAPRRLANKSFLVASELSSIDPPCPPPKIPLHSQVLGQPLLGGSEQNTEESLTLPATCLTFAELFAAQNFRLHRSPAPWNPFPVPGRHDGSFRSRNPFQPHTRATLDALLASRLWWPERLCSLVSTIFNLVLNDRLHGVDQRAFSVQQHRTLTVPASKNIKIDAHAEYFISGLSGGPRLVVSCTSPGALDKPNWDADARDVLACLCGLGSGYGLITDGKGWVFYEMEYKGILSQSRRYNLGDEDGEIEDFMDYVLGYVIGTETPVLEEWWGRDGAEGDQSLTLPNG